MTTIDVRVVIKQPLEVVEQAFLNAEENAPYWETDLERFEVVSGAPGQAGAQARLHYVQNGQRYSMEDVMEEYIAGQYFRSRVSGGGIDARVETWMQTVEEGTEVRMRWQGQGTSMQTRLMLPLLAGRIKKHSQAELETFKALVEERGAHFSEE